MHTDLRHAVSLDQLCTADSWVLSSVCVYQAVGCLTNKGLVRALLKLPLPIPLLVFVLPFAARVGRNFLRMGGNIFGPKKTPELSKSTCVLQSREWCCLKRSHVILLAPPKLVPVWITMYARAHIRRHIFFVSLKSHLIFRVLIATMIKQVPSTPL